ncbi:hypothetical protein C8R48DRAFT_684647 [Suillus tomentosus]|nr:hypothetical protein C8R48DRAFT_684647 [Suillus tomentosus]
MSWMISTTFSRRSMLTSKVHAQLMRTGAAKSSAQLLCCKRSTELLRVPSRRGVKVVRLHKEMHERHERRKKNESARELEHRARGNKVAVSRLAKYC